VGSSVFSRRDSVTAYYIKTKTPAQNKAAYVAGKADGADGGDVFEAVNGCLDRIGVPHELNEGRLVAMADAVWASNRLVESVCWLTLARLAEAALLCAGLYADSCEFKAAGDLVLNPRKIQVYVNGSEKSFAKERHARLSDQLTALFPPDQGTSVDRRDAVCDIVQPALIPYLYGKLTASGYFTRDYLQRLQRRMIAVTETIRFLSAWQVDTVQILQQRLSDGDAAQSSFIREHLCNFDDTWFQVLGRRIQMSFFRGIQPVGYRKESWQDERCWVEELAQNN